MKLRILDILNEKCKTKYWLYIRLGLSYQNFNRIVKGETKSIKFETLSALCNILECTPNDLFEDYYGKWYKKKVTAFSQKKNADPNLKVGFLYALFAV